MSWIVGCPNEVCCCRTYCLRLEMSRSRQKLLIEEGVGKEGAGLPRADRQKERGGKKMHHSPVLVRSATAAN